jgi:hypothetical protein
MAAQLAPMGDRWVLAPAIASDSRHLVACGQARPIRAWVATMVAMMAIVATQTVAMRR